MLPFARRKDFPTAFVTYNTGMAAGAAMALQREGWKVPTDISLASADVSRLSIEGALRITGAGTSPDKLGEAAARVREALAAAQALVLQQRLLQLQKHQLRNNLI